MQTKTRKAALRLEDWRGRTGFASNSDRHDETEDISNKDWPPDSTRANTSSDASGQQGGRAHFKRLPRSCWTRVPLRWE